MNHPFITQGILKYQDSSCNCVVLNEEIVLAPGSILESHVRNSDSTVSLESLRKSDAILLPKENVFHVKLRDKKCSQDSSLYECEVQLFTGIFCAEIYDLLLTHLHDFFDNITIHLKSYFLVLNTSKCNSASVETIFWNYHRQGISKLQVFDDVLTVSTPFNSESFYSSVHSAKIANVIKQTLFVLSSSMPLGCDGCPVFDRRLKLIGLLLFTMVKKNNENLDLTCAVSFSTIIRSFLSKKGFVKLTKTQHETFHHYLTKSLIRVKGNNFVGTGVLVSVQSKPYILTCSHVLDNLKINDIIRCQGMEETINARLIWRNENFEDPYDLAILEPQTILPHVYCSEISTDFFLCQKVFAVGFPFYSDDNEFNPSIYPGQITRCNPYLIQHDANLHYGQSGGPLFDANGRLLGICHSNVKWMDRIYPKMALSIPLADVKRKLEVFNKSKDVKDLEELGSVSEDVKRAWFVRTDFKL